MSNEQQYPNQFNGPANQIPADGAQNPQQGWAGQTGQPQGWENSGMQTPQGWENTGWQQGQYPQAAGNFPQARPKQPSPVGDFIAGVTDFSLTKPIKAGFGKLYFTLVYLGSTLLWILAVAYSFKQAFHLKHLSDGHADIDIFWLLMAIFTLLIGWVFVLANVAKARMTVDIHKHAQLAIEEAENKNTTQN